jgi:hypothetical protein
MDAQARPRSREPGIDHAPAGGNRGFRGQRARAPRTGRRRAQPVRRPRQEELAREETWAPGGEDVREAHSRQGGAGGHLDAEGHDELLDPVSPADGDSGPQHCPARSREHQHGGRFGIAVADAAEESVESTPGGAGLAAEPGHRQGPVAVHGAELRNGCEDAATLTADRFESGETGVGVSGNAPQDLRVDGPPRRPQRSDRPRVADVQHPLGQLVGQRWKLSLSALEKLGPEDSLYASRYPVAEQRGNWWRAGEDFALDLITCIADLPQHRRTGVVAIDKHQARGSRALGDEIRQRPDQGTQPSLPIRAGWRGVGELAGGPSQDRAVRGDEALLDVGEVGVEGAGRDRRCSRQGADGEAGVAALGDQVDRRILEACSLVGANVGSGKPRTRPELLVQSLLPLYGLRGPENPGVPLPDGVIPER